MELLFRKYFWTVELTFLAISAFLLASIGNGVLASKLTPKADAQAMMPAAKAAPTSPAFGRGARLNLEGTAALLGIELPQEEPETKEPDKPAFDPNAPPVQSSLRVTLVGTMAANRPEWSFATIRDETTKDAGVYLVGDLLLGAEVLEIERLRVILLNEGRKEFISIDGPGAQLPPSMPMAAAPTKSPPGGGDLDVRQVGDNAYEISREDVEKQLSNLNTIATQARIVPSFKNGEANGFKVFSIRPGSIYQKLGIQNGDVIKKINGYEINSPDKALEVYAKLKEASKIDVELERRGSTTNQSVTVK